MFKDTDDGKTRFYCECASTRTYNNGVCETCGGVETPLQTIYEEHEMTPDERIDAALDSVLKASGSGLKNYTMKLALDRMREAMRKVMLDSYIAGSNDSFEAMNKMTPNDQNQGDSGGFIAGGSARTQG